MPRPKNEQIQNGRQFEWKLNIFTLLAYLYILFLLVVTWGMFMMSRKPFLKVSWNFIFSFSRNRPFCEIFDMRALFNIYRRWSCTCTSNARRMKGYVKFYHPCKFERCSLHGLLAASFFVFHSTTPLKCIGLKVRWPLCNCNGVVYETQKSPLRANRVSHIVQICREDKT